MSWIDHHFYVGLDLGLTRNPSALVVLHKWNEPGPRDPVSWQFSFRRRIDVRHAERFPLSDTWKSIVQRVHAVLRHPDFRYPVSLVVDATGAGSAVVEMLRDAALPCTIYPVTITSGDHPTDGPLGKRVPRTALLAGIRVALESGDLQFSSRMYGYQLLLRELENLSKSKDTTDDLCFALALALYRARQPEVGEKSNVRIV